MRILSQQTQNCSLYLDSRVVSSSGRFTPEAHQALADRDTQLQYPTWS